jgi:hypothetical protein
MNLRTLTGRNCFEHGSSCARQTTGGGSPHATRGRLPPHEHLHHRRGDGGATLGSLGFALQGALQCLIEGGFRFFVLLLTNETLLVFDFEFEEFFFQAFEQL